MESSPVHRACFEILSARRLNRSVTTAADHIKAILISFLEIFERAHARWRVFDHEDATKVMEFISIKQGRPITKYF